MAKRSCCIVGCSNNGRQLIKWSQIYCDIHDCNKGTCRCICEPPFQLFPFPTKDLETRKLWIQIVNRKSNDNKIWEPNYDSRICSEHFADGYPSTSNPYPTLKLGYNRYKTPKFRPPPLDRSFCNASPVKRRKKETEHASVTSDTPVLVDTLSSSVETLDLSISSDQNNCQVHDHDYSLTCEGCFEKNKTIHDLEQQVRILKHKLYASENKLSQSQKAKPQEKNIKSFDINTVLKNDSKIKFYTGIPSVQVFDTIYETVEPIVKSGNLRYWLRPSRLANVLRPKTKFLRVRQSRRLTIKEEFILTLMKLRLGLLSEDIADRFNISVSSVSSIFTTWVKVLSGVLGKLVFNPSKEIVKTNLPPTFNTPKYRDVRHIIDCTEVFIETPNNLELQALTWSDYKHHQTAKTLVSINPSGMINYVSPAYGGRASDKFITNNSGFLDIVEPYDKIMADRGFQIREELALLCAELLVPPGRRGVSQMTKTEVTSTKEIANRRIFVEQAIRRMKCFRILKFELPLTLLQHLDDINQIIAGICNLYPPLPRYDRQ